MIRMYTSGKFSGGRVLLRKSLTALGGLGAIGFLGGLVFAFTQDVSRFVPALDSVLSAELGHDVTVGGPIKLDLARGPEIWISVEGIDLKPSDRVSFSAEISKARALVRLLPLFNRSVEIEVLAIDGAKVRTDAAISFGESFGQRIASQAKAGKRWNVTALRKVMVNASEFSIDEAGVEIFQFPVNNASAEPGDAGLVLRLDGEVEGRQVTFSGRSGPWAALMTGHRVYLDGVVRSHSAEITLSGSVGEPSTHGLELLIRGGAENLNDVATLFGFGDLSRTSKMTVSAHVKGTVSGVSIGDLKLTYGRGDLSGWFDVSRGERLVIDGELKSDFLDLAAFEGGRLLHPPKKLFPDSPLPVSLIQSLDGEISFSAGTILLANAKLVDGQISMVASDGMVAINPIAVTYNEGTFDASIVLDARKEPGFKGAVNLSNFDLGGLLSAAKMSDDLEARLHFGGRLRGKGETIAQMFANASGQTNLLMGEGRLSSEALDLFGGREAIGLTPDMSSQSGDDAVELKCFVNRFDVVQGIAKSRAFLMETGDSVTTGRGSVNLSTETLDLRLAPRPKNPAYLKGAADLRVTGSFLEPKFRVDRQKMSRGIAGSLGRFALARQGNEVLLPLIEQPATRSNACITALTGKKVTSTETSRTLSLSQVQ